MSSAPAPGRRANPLRGEMDLELGDRSLVLRPTFERLVAAEGEIGSLSALLDRLAEGDFRIGEAECLLWCCLEPAGLERAEMRALLMAAGLGPVLEAYRRLLALVFGGC